MKRKKKGSHEYGNKYYWRDPSKEYYRGYSHPPKSNLQKPNFEQQYRYSTYKQH